MIFSEAEDVPEAVLNAILKYPRDLAEFGSDIDDIEFHLALSVFVGLFNVLEQAIKTVGLQVIDNCSTIGMATGEM